ncbi:AAA family ATPase [Kitasatospora sp. NPDC004531]
MPSPAHEYKTEFPLPEGLTDGGSSANFSVHVNQISMIDGTEVHPPRGGVTVIVGGNNSGKSTFLRDLWTKLSRPEQTVYKTKIIEGVDIAREGSEADIFAWFKENSKWSGTKYNNGFLDGNGGRAVTVGNVRSFAREKGVSQSLSKVSGHIVYRADLHKRIEAVAPVEQRADLGDPPTHPLHHLQDSPDLLSLIQQLSNRIFRQNLTLERIGRRTQLRVGQTDVGAPAVDSITPEYVQSLAKLPPLESQGDGMRSLLGLLLPLTTSPCRVMLVDEPEAFLHPPQAKIAGAVLGELAARRGIQIFLATHDRNLLTGLLEAGAPVSVVRLDRRSNETEIHQLDHEMVQHLWNDPVLKYSNVLDGLFHRAVVLAEADGDCRFFAASLEGVEELPFSPGDIQFTPVGGKDGFARTVKSLRSVSVPLVVVADLDILNEPRKIRTLIEAMGGSWSSFESDYRKATGQFKLPRTPKTRGQVLELVNKVLDENPQDRYDKFTEGLILAALRADRSPWQDLKEFGVRSFRDGASANAAERLLNDLESIGIVLVREGELERLAPSVESRKGPEWISEALRKQEYLGARAQEHIKTVVRSIVKQLT